MGPGRGNERGHWEPERLVACHDRLLKKLGSQWNDWQSIGASQLPAPDLADFKRELSDLIDADYPESSLFVLKEPRLCRLVPFYAELLCEKGIEPRYLLAIRNPLAVIHSLSDLRWDIAGARGAALVAACARCGTCNAQRVARRRILRTGAARLAPDDAAGGRAAQPALASAV
jgi:hypothetical protein